MELDSSFFTCLCGFGGEKLFQNQISTAATSVWEEVLAIFDLIGNFFRSIYELWDNFYNTFYEKVKATDITQHELDIRHVEGIVTETTSIEEDISKKNPYEIAWKYCQDMKITREDFDQIYAKLKGLILYCFNNNWPNCACLYVKKILEIPIKYRDIILDFLSDSNWFVLPNHQYRQLVYYIQEIGKINLSDDVFNKTMQISMGLSDTFKNPSIVLKANILHFYIEGLQCFQENQQIEMLESVQAIENFKYKFHLANGKNSGLDSIGNHFKFTRHLWCLRKDNQTLIMDLLDGQKYNIEEVLKIIDTANILVPILPNLLTVTWRMIFRYFIK